jgi:hypothetical protein
MRVQTPAACLPLKMLRLSSGLKVPAKGGAPLAIGVLAWLSNVVNVPEQLVGPAP